MSYVVTVQRDAPITSEELRTILADQPEYSMSDISVDDDDDSLELRWNPDSDSESTMFVLSGGKIDSFTPSDDALEQLQVLAKLLNATVVGEEGEDLTDVAVATNKYDGCGPFVWSMIVVAVFLLIYWVWN